MEAGRAMIGRVGDICGNTLAIGAATIASISQEDMRLWFVAVGGLLITFIGNVARTKQRKREAQAALYDAQRRRILLCRECQQSNWLISSSCVVEAKHRPAECPLGKDNQ